MNSNSLIHNPVVLFFIILLIIIITVLLVYSTSKEYRSVIECQLKEIDSYPHKHQKVIFNPGDKYALSSAHPAGEEIHEHLLKRTGEVSAKVAEKYDHTHEVECRRLP